jgi:hypothetical protein
MLVQASIALMKKAQGRQVQRRILNGTNVVNGIDPDEEMRGGGCMKMASLGCVLFLDAATT